MRTIFIDQYEEQTVILERGLDYAEQDIEADPFVYKGMVVKKDRLDEIARAHGFDCCSWRGCEGFQTELGICKLGVKAMLRKSICGR